VGAHLGIGITYKKASEKATNLVCDTPDKVETPNDILQKLFWVRSSADQKEIARIFQIYFFKEASILSHSL
jgi:hypothetical protein